MISKIIAIVREKFALSSSPGNTFKDNVELLSLAQWNNLRNRKNLGEHIKGSFPVWFYIRQYSCIPFKKMKKKSTYHFVADITLHAGDIGIYVNKKNGKDTSQSEYVLSDPGKHVLHFRIKNIKSIHDIVIRNRSAHTCPDFTLFYKAIIEIPLEELSLFKTDILSIALKNPCAARKAVTDALKIPSWSPLHLAFDYPTYILSDTNLWKAPYEKIIAHTSQELIALLPSYVAQEMGNNNITLDQSFFKKYLYMNNSRIIHLYELLTEYALPPHARILEIGSYFGSFALSLQRLGFHVTAVDRYQNYGTAFQEYTALMRKEGVTVIETCRENEQRDIEALETFDVVISMAVIEHIPHTPRLFLQNLLKKLNHKGILAIDTPNLTRYWNRKRFKEGETIFMPIEEQFMCEIPFEWHHREYTLKELRWIYEKLGLANIKSRLFNYNELQFDTLSRDHIECLLTCIENNTKSDTVLIAGQKSDV